MPPLSWADLAGRRVGLWGLGVEGRVSLARLTADGNLPSVIVDDAPREVAVIATNDGGLEALASCDVVIKTPGLSRYADGVRWLEAAGVRVAGGLGLWLASTDRGRVACITGTKGKSTVTALAAHLGRGLGIDARAAGNIGSPPWDPVVETEPDVWLVETSSYQALDVEIGPRVVAVTSLSQDHLPWHRGDPETYYRDKLSLCTRPGVELVVANYDNPLIVGREALLGPNRREVLAAQATGTWIDELALPGAHNRRNALMAQAVLVGLGVSGAGDEGRLGTAALDFPGLESRLQSVGSVGGVDFVNDSLSTNVLSALGAVEAFGGRRVALLVGGQDRGIDYAPLAEGLAGRAAPLWVGTIPTNGHRVGELLRAAGVHTVDFPDLRSAVFAAHAWASDDGVVLLSPAAPSFDVFTDYRDRAAVFASAMNDLAEHREAPADPGRVGRR